MPGATPSAREGVTGRAVELRAALDLRYVGQWHELTVAVELPLDVDAAAAAFHAEHDRLFGHASPGAPIELLALRLSAVGRTREARARPRHRTTARLDARRGERPVWDPDERALVPTPVWDGRQLAVSSTLDGPAIVELSNTTIVVPRGFALDVDAYGAFVVQQRRARRRARPPPRRRGAPLTAEARLPGSVAAWKRAPGRHCCDSPGSRSASRAWSPCDDVDLALQAGVVHALTGENGSGKSTLARIASGALAPDAGRIEFEGVERTIGSPKQALELGIVTISQELDARADPQRRGEHLPRPPAARAHAARRLAQAAGRRARGPRQPRRARRRAPCRRRAERRAPAGGRDRARRLLARAAADPRRGHELALRGRHPAAARRWSSGCARAVSPC